MAKQEKKLSDGALKAYEMLKENENGLTIAEMKDLGFTNVNSSHLTALKNRGIVDSVQVEREVVTVVKRKVNVYTLTGKEVE